ncbi:MAG: TraB/GumN family protein, partial [Myxococcales bacterium]|nr:TraB/GumN family protein [Myxococcales bacterium]
MSLTHRSTRGRAFLAWLGCLLALVACSDPNPAAPGGGAALVSASSEASASAPPVVASASASSPAPSISASPSSTPGPVVTATPVMFEVKKGDVLAGYLFGTMHTGVDAEKELNPIVFTKLDEAKVVVMEADVFNVDPFEIAKTAMYPPGKSVVKDLKPEHWKIVVDRLASFLMPESSLAQMKPWFIGTMLVQKMLPEVEPIDSVIYK